MSRSSVRVLPLIAGSIVMAVLSGTAVAANKAPETIMRANCGSCHGQKGEGGTSWVDTGRRAFRLAGMSCSRITTWVRAGRIPEMPAFPAQEISDTELNSLCGYIKGLPNSYLPEPAAQHTVTITDEDPWYNPMQIGVNVGDTVKFINMGKTYHPVTQLEYVAARGASGTDSGLLGSSRSSSLYAVYYRQFNEPAGTKVTFLCKIHPYMRGEVYVGTPIVVPPRPLYPVVIVPPPSVPGVGEVYYNAQWQDPAPGTKAPDPVDGKVKDGVVHVITASNWTDAYQIPVGNNPHNIWMGKGNTKALTTNWFDNTVSLIDTASKSVLGEYIAGAAPAHVTSDWAGNNWYVTIEASYYVQEMDQRRMSLGSTAYVSGYGPHGTWYCAGKLVTTNSMDNTFSVIDAKTMTHLATVPIGLYPLGASCNSTGTLGAAGNYLDGTVSIIGLSGNAVIRNVPLPGNPVQVPFTPDDNYIVAAASPYACVIDVNKAIATNPDGSFVYPDSSVAACIGTGRGTHGVAFIPKQGGGQYAVVSHKYENYMSVVDITNPMLPVKAGDVQLVTTTTNKWAIVGITDTGGNAIASNPNPAPWQ